MKRYHPTARPGTSGADHLSYEVEEHLLEEGYATRTAAEHGWVQACRAADDTRQGQGYRPVSRPDCWVESHYPHSSEPPPGVPLRRSPDMT